MKNFIAAFFLMLVTYSSYSQDILPHFSVRQLSPERVQISWKNPYKGCNQLAIQRSYDSLRFFKTIFSPQSPELPQNGFIDNTPAPGVKVFYRIFYVLADGNYFFTKSQMPVVSTDKKETETKHDKSVIKKDTVQTEMQDEPEIDTVVVKPIHWVSIFKKSKDSLITKIDIDFFKKYRDSVRIKTKDTIVTVGIDEYMIKPFVPKPVWKASKYLFTNTDGYIILKVPELQKHYYKIIFTEEKGDEIFILNNVTDEYLMIDKSNFPHAGWFFYIMYEDGKVFEKNKFFVESDL